MKRIKRRTWIACILIAIIGGSLYIAHRRFYEIPKSRIGLTEIYSTMPEDSFHHYINLPIDHSSPFTEMFRGFYLLSPSFYKSSSITFLLTDGQMELVTTQTDFSFFEKILGSSAYVLIGVRGHSPTFFPEVYKDGKVDYQQAMRLYSSDQQVEDIEQVRQDMIAKGLLAADAKINVFGASGAGVLAQQYISKYGNHVQRMILESTGAPDLSAKFNTHYAIDFNDYNPAADSILQLTLKGDKKNKQLVCNILYQVGRSVWQPKAEQLKIVKAVHEGSWLLSYRSKPVTNLPVLKYMIQAPREIAARVRWFELVGHDLMAYDAQKGINLLYELSTAALPELIAYCRNNNYKPKIFTIDRTFAGEVLILKGTEDVVFSDFINQRIQQTYPNARLILFKDGHRMQHNTGLYREIRTAFFKKGFESKLVDSFVRAKGIGIVHPL